MQLKATIEQKHGVSIIHFEGQLDFAHTLVLKEKLQEVYLDKKNKKLLFNFEKLEFVGSSGIRPFIQYLKKFNRSDCPPRYYGVSPEYRKIFQALEGRSKFDIYLSEEEAFHSYHIYNHNFKKGGRA